VTAHPWPLRSYLELGALPTAVPCARLHARHLVWEWGLNGLADSTELLVSELVTNAVKATAGQEDQAAVRLRLSSDNARVLIEVWDADPQPPAPQDLSQDGTPDPHEERGRGLFLVATLSTRWDWYLTQEPAGKVVWCELGAKPPEPSEGAQAAPQALLPRRIPRSSTAKPRMSACSPHLGRAMAALRDDLIPTRRAPDPFGSLSQAVACPFMADGGQALLERLRVVAGDLVVQPGAGQGKDVDGGGLGVPGNRDVRSGG